MAITRVKTSSVAQGPSTKKTVSGGNDTILPGSYDAIGVVTVGAGGTSSLSFTSIPGTYKHLQVRIFANNSDVNAALFTFNSNTGSNYRFHRLVGNGSNASAASSPIRESIPVGSGIGLPSGTSIFAGAVMDIFDYTSTLKNKTTRTMLGYDSNGSGGVEYSSGLWFATPAAITRIDIVAASGTFAQHSQFALYGIR